MRLRSIIVATCAVVLFSAAPALADYPPTFTAVTAVQSAAAQNNFTLTATTKAITKASVNVLASSSGSAKLPAVSVETPVAPKVSGLPKQTDVVLKVIINGKWVVLGTARTSADGKVQFPAVSFGDSGKYTLVAVLPGSSKTFKFPVTVK